MIFRIYKIYPVHLEKIRFILSNLILSFSDRPCCFWITFRFELSIS